MTLHSKLLLLFFNYDWFSTFVKVAKIKENCIRPWVVLIIIFVVGDENYNFPLKLSNSQNICQTFAILLPRN